MIDGYSSLFGKYDFFLFQIQIQIIYKICTKVRGKNCMFEIVFAITHLPYKNIFFYKISNL